MQSKQALKKGGPEDMKNQLTDEAKEARRAYRRQWNAKNKDKVKAAQARYWNKKALQMQQNEAEAVQEATEAAEA